jgi:hypothetical protein
MEKGEDVELGFGSLRLNVRLCGGQTSAWVLKEIMRTESNYFVPKSPCKGSDVNKSTSSSLLSPSSAYGCLPWMRLDEASAWDDAEWRDGELDMLRLGKLYREYHLQKAHFLVYL